VSIETGGPVLRMSAYYYAFDPTGVPEIDRILSAVACAGKAYHNTSEWLEGEFTPDGHAGNTPVEWIQLAAQDAANAMLKAREAKHEPDEIFPGTAEALNQLGIRK